MDNTFTPRSHLSRRSIPRDMNWCTPEEQPPPSPCPPGHRSPSPSPPGHRSPSPCPPGSPPSPRQHIQLNWNTPPEMQPKMPGPLPPIRQFEPFSPSKHSQRQRTPSPCPRPRTPSPSPPSPCPQFELGWSTPPEQRPRTPVRPRAREFSPFSPPPSSPFQGPLTECTPPPFPCPPSPPVTGQAARMRGHFHNLDDSDERPTFEEQMMHPDFYEHIHGYDEDRVKSPYVAMPMRKVGWAPPTKKNPGRSIYKPWKAGTQHQIGMGSPYPEGYQLKPGEVDLCKHHEDIDWIKMAGENPPYEIQRPFRPNLHSTYGTVKPMMKCPSLPTVRELGISPGSGRFTYDAKIAEFSHMADKIISITRARLDEEFEKIFGVRLEDVLKKEREDPISYTRERINKKFQERFGETLLEVLEGGKCK